MHVLEWTLKTYHRWIYFNVAIHITKMYQKAKWSNPNLTWKQNRSRTKYYQIQPLTCWCFAVSFSIFRICPKHLQMRKFLNLDSLYFKFNVPITLQQCSLHPESQLSWRLCNKCVLTNVPTMSTKSTRKLGTPSLWKLSYVSLMRKNSLIKDMQ